MSHLVPTTVGVPAAQGTILYILCLTLTFGEWVGIGKRQAIDALGLMLNTIFFLHNQI